MLQRALISSTTPGNCLIYLWRLALHVPFMQHLTTSGATDLHILMLNHPQTDFSIRGLKIECTQSRCWTGYECIVKKTWKKLSLGWFKQWVPPRTGDGVYENSSGSRRLECSWQHPSAEWTNPDLEMWLTHKKGLGTSRSWHVSGSTCDAFCWKSPCSSSDEI